MNEQNFKRALRDLAETSIPDNYTQWEEIEMKLKLENTPLPGMTRRRRFRRYFLIAAVLMLLSTASYAVYQSTLQDQIYGDQGLSGVVEAGYVTELNISQRVDDVEVVLDWAYMDELRITLQYSIYVLDEEGNRLPVDSDPDYYIRLTDHAGSIPVQFPSRETRGTSSESVRLDFYLPPDSNGLSEQVNFQMELVFVETPHIREYFERWFGGYGLRSGSPSGMNGDPDMPLPDGIGPFTFNFSLSKQSAVTMATNQSVTSNGVTVTLEQVVCSISDSDAYLRR